MRKGLTRSFLAAATPLIVYFLAAAPLTRAQVGGAIITPAGAYSDPSWGQKATKYQSHLQRVQSECQRRFRPADFRLLSNAESAVGGVGFWPYPLKFGDSRRYLCVFARVQFPPPSTGRAFPDTQSGHFLTIMDAYGKDAINILAAELQQMNDPQIAGGAIIFIHSKRPLTDPAFESDAESLGLFMPTDGVIKFSQLKMTVQTLVSQSEKPLLLQGGEQMQHLRMFIIQP